jgi:hypothetical protein
MIRLIKKELLTTKPNLLIFALVAAVVLSVGYIMALAILAPQQLAEATAAASDLVCSGCVGNSDIADSAVTSAKIGSGQVGNSDLASSAVTTTKIGSGQVGASDIANGAVTTGKISDTNGVYSVDIVNGQVGSADIGDSQVTSADIKDSTVTSTDLASGAIQPGVHIEQGSEVNFNPNSSGSATTDCDSGEILTGGGFVSAGSPGLDMTHSFPIDENTWYVQANNFGTTVAIIRAFALCVGPSP